MAVRDTTKKPFIADRDDNIFIGIDYPFHKSDGPEGYFKSTETTIKAVKNNIKLLLSTEKGERIMQISMGPDTDVGRNTMTIRVDFNITRDPNTLESVQVEIGE